MQLRLLEYFVALAREGHFARAATACNVTQPTLSAGIAALEEQLGKRLIDRDRRFIGLTEEGRAALPWAQQAIAMIDGLAHAAETARGPLRGTLRLGAIPAAMPVVGHFARTLGAANPELTLSVRSLTSREIEQALAAFELDAGLTYLDHEPPAQVIAVPLYTERAMFVARAGSGFDDRKAVDWPDVLTQPLCLLHEGMQNRRIFDTNLAGRGFAAHPRATADSYVALLAMVEAGGFATVVPEGYAALIPAGTWARILPFAEPFPASRVGLVVLDRRPSSQLAQAALAAAHAVKLPRSYRHR
ncbi:MAG: LysR family transcriptional regulator [Candidatus Sphingomonas phytovorans]|nr:LysR family transcriptional regulator [Sphingomonas sp.]WEK00878.1 MAG: LysR family transcriptional regulator [Sphingomonas sp.]